MKRKMIVGKILALAVAGTMVTSSFATSITAYADVFTEKAEVETKAESFNVIGAVESFETNGNDVNLELTTGESIKVSILDQGVFRIYMDPEGEFQEDPTPNAASHTTKIIHKTEDQYPQTAPTVVDGDIITISTEKIELRIEKATSKMELFNKATNKVVWSETEPLKYNNSKTIQTLASTEDEYFYGGGTQNGRFSHKGKSIEIKNTNNWVDGGVASPNPFYWSTNGYGVMRHTFKPGVYDFGAVNAGKVTAEHNEKRFDAYYFIEETPQDIITGYTELTGAPAMMPEYAFYLGHADCYSRDWINDETGQESQTQRPGFDRQETLMVDGKKVVDEHIEKDMPLGWFMPNDGYGCGYGREDSIDGNIENLKELVDYTRDFGIQTSLWTQSTLKPTGQGEVYLERDIDKEVGVAGTNAVKTDVAWVGPGYSFALNSVRQAAEGIINNSKDDARPFLMSLDGWAGTQRYATIWSGDQYGGDWEYIRFHIPTYIGTGLSGNPNIGSDMDGIFGGSSLVQTRDFQWKAFTPVQIDMDGWGSADKTPYEFGDPYESINRMYLKLKAEMMPYNYSISEESVETGMPMIRAMMLEYPNEYTYGSSTEYQYMWGPNMLVAPIYQDTAADSNGNDIRNDIYLPDDDQVWIDYFTGEQYAGGGVINNFDAPIWKLPVFIKNGAIIPLANENNNPEQIDDSKRKFEVYPSGDTSFEVYEDDGLSTDYLEGQSATTMVTSKAPKTGEGTAIINVGTLDGSYDGIVTERETEFVVNVSEKPSSLEATVGGNDVTLTEATSLEEFEAGTNMYFYDESPNLNKYSTEGSDFEDVKITTTPKVYAKVEATDVTTNAVELTVNDFINVQDMDKNQLNENLDVPSNFAAPEEEITPETVTLTWNAVEDATSYDVEIDGIVFKGITENQYVSLGLEYDTVYNYRVRSVNADGYSEWSEKLSPRTELDPFRNVPKDMVTIWNEGNWSSDEPANAVDGDENSQFHSSGSAIDRPFIIDMQKAYEIEKLDLLFRAHGNGSVKRAEIYSSLDGITYEKVFTNASDSGNAAWATDGQANSIEFENPINARYFKIVTKESIGNFLTMREFRPYKVDGTDGKVVGDWNNSGTIESGDLTFLQNYTGLSSVDADWDYVAAADLNANGLIDAYDIAYVASMLEGGVVETETEMAGELMLIPSKTDIKAGEKITVDVVGTGLADINAFGAEISLPSDKFELAEGGVRQTIATAGMMNLSKVRVHSDSTQDLYVMLTNVGENLKLKGTESVAKFEVIAKEDMTWDMEMTHALVVDSKMNSKDAVAEITDINAELPEAGNGLSKIDSSVITVSGDETQLQTGMGLDKLIDGTTSSDDSSRMDLKWVFSTDQTDKGELPFEMTFDFDEAKEFDNFTIYNRMNGNQINSASMKKVKAVGYLNGVPTELGEKDVNTATTVYELNGQEFDKIVITALESHKDQYTLAINEIEFYQNVGAEETGIDFVEDTVSTLTQNKLTPIFAKVSPDDAVNPYYRITSSDPETVQVIRLDSGNIVNYYLRGLKGGTATITATTADGSFSTTTEVTVGEGVDKTVLIEAVEIAKEYAKLDEIYTTETYQALLDSIKAAEAIIADTTVSETEVSDSILDVRTKVQGLEERPTVDADKIPFGNTTAIDATTEADSDFMENAVDGNSDTIWHSGYQSADTLPVSITIELDKNYDLNQIDYMPRQNSRNGHINKYKIETSLDGENWTVARIGELEVNSAGTALENIGFNPIRFNTVEAKYVKVTALESLGDTNNKYASVAELAFYGQASEVEAANKEVLQVTVGLAKGITDEELAAAIPVAREEFTAALAEAEDVLANETATQAEVDASNSRLAAAIEGLETVAGDKTKLIDLVERLKAINKEEYLPNTVVGFEAAFVAAEAMIANENATTEDVQASYDTLMRAYLDLRLKPSKDKLEDLISSVADLNEADYTAETWAKVQVMLATANDVMADENATAEDVQDAVDGLNDSVNNLEEKEEVTPVDKTELAKVIENAEAELVNQDKYTEDSFNALLQSLDKAKEVFGKSDATIEEVEAAAVGLQGAIQGLDKVETENPDVEDENDDEVVNKATLSNKIKEALNFLASDYTADSFAKLQAALSKAQAVEANEESSQLDVDTALAELQAAIDGMVEVDVESDKDEDKTPVKPETPDNDKDDDKDGNLPQTGGVATGLVGALGALMAAVGIKLNKKKRD